MNAAGAAPWRDDDGLVAGVLTRRVWAWLLDLLLISAGACVLWVLLAAFGLLTFGLGLPLLTVLPAFPVLYHFLFLAGPLCGTPGQAVMGLTVRREHDLGRPGGWQAAASTLGLYATLAAGAVWLGLALLTNRHRTPHDLVSGLVVVRRRSLTRGGRKWNMSRGLKDI